MNIPFYQNTKDDLRCFQACFKMVLGYWLPDAEFSFLTLDKITGRKPKQWTWDTQTLVWLVKHGFDVIKITPLNYQKFARGGRKYLKTFWYPEVYKRQNKMSNLVREQNLARKLMRNKHLKFITKSPGLMELDQYFQKNYAIIANVNPRILDNKSGYSNHSVVVVNVNKRMITFHDPGLPAEKNRVITRTKFKKALKEIVAIGLVLIRRT